MLNKIFEVFTKQYRQKTKMFMTEENYVNEIKLKSENYDADAAIQLLKDISYQSNFSINLSKLMI